MSFSFAGKRVLVTGGTRGIGRAAVDAFLKAGARVAVNGRTAQSTHAALSQLGQNAVAAPGDVARAEECRALVATAVEALKKGALDFIQKPFNEEQLLGTVERMLDKAREAFAEHQQAANRDALLAKLTGREGQVLERIVAGRLNKQIADDLGISIKTVEAHRANIMEKLGANTVADLLKIALGKDAVKA